MRLFGLSALDATGGTPRGHNGDRGQKDEVEINYSIASDHWGQGYATEAATRFVELGFEHLPVESLIAFTLIPNAGSRRVMEKIGLTYSHDFDHHGNLHVLYRVHRADVVS